MKYKKKIICIISVLFSFCGIAQSIVVDYDTKIIVENSVIVVESRLVNYNGSSIFELFFDKSRETAEHILIQINNQQNAFVFKRFSDNTIIYKDYIANRKFAIKDELGIFNWTLTTEKKELLGYQCQKAVGYFRGRNYEVYFTPEIPLTDGPWK
jgi:GLPGLI family protein